MNLNGLALFKGILLLGLACWTGLLLFNNVQKAKTVIDAFERIMSMRELKTIPAFIELSEKRGITSDGLYRLAYWLLIGLQTFSALAMLLAGVEFVALGVAGGPASPAVLLHANVGLSLFLVMWFFFLIGGAWFLYWIKAEGLQITHIALLTLTVASAMLVNISP